MGDWSGFNEAVPYGYTGGAAVIGRLMFHARQVQQGKRKPWTWALLWDLPIALGMGWGIYGLCVWAGLGPEPTVSAAIAASYLGPYRSTGCLPCWRTSTWARPRRHDPFERIEA